MSNQHALKLAGGILNDWVAPDSRGLFLVTGSAGHVNPFLVELAAHWLPPLLVAANQRSANSAPARLHWVSFFTTEETVRLWLQKFGARRDASTYSSVQEFLKENNSLDRLLEHLVDQYKALTKENEGVTCKPILVLEDISPLVYLGRSTAEVFHLILRFCQLVNLAQASNPNCGVLVVGCHCPDNDAILNRLSACLKSLSAITITAKPLESGYLPEVDGKVTLDAPVISAATAAAAAAATNDRSDPSTGSCPGRWRSAAYHYLVTDRQVRCFPLGLSRFAAG